MVSALALCWASIVPCAAVAEETTALTIYSTARPGAVPADLYRPLPGGGTPGRHQTVPGYAVIKQERVGRSDDYFASNPDELEARQQADLDHVPEPSVTDRYRNESAAVEKLFWGPTSVVTDDDGRLFVVDSCRHRVQIYQKG